MPNKDSILYFHRLDSLRFFAFCTVFWEHGYAPMFKNITTNPIFEKLIDVINSSGRIGVQFFFVISGFLITYLMIKEEVQTGKLNIKFFYIRRIIRIWPLYYFVMIMGLFILPNLFNSFKYEGNYIVNLIFLNNVDMDTQKSSVVGIAWSVAIEEQFYLLWPIVFTIIKNKKILLCFCFALFSASIFYIYQNPTTAYFKTWGNINYLMTGCIGGILFSTYNSKISRSAFFNSSCLKYGVFIALMCFLLSPFNQFIWYISRIILPCIYLYIILNLINRKQNNKISKISLLGKYTYGMYLFHPTILIFTYILFYLTGLNTLPDKAETFLAASVSLLITIAISIFSYEYIEKRILRIKEKFTFISTRI